MLVRSPAKYCATLNHLAFNTLSSFLPTQHRQTAVAEEDGVRTYSFVVVKGENYFSSTVKAVNGKTLTLSSSFGFLQHTAQCAQVCLTLSFYFFGFTRRCDTVPFIIRQNHSINFLQIPNKVPFKKKSTSDKIIVIWPQSSCRRCQPGCCLHPADWGPVHWDLQRERTAIQWVQVRVTTNFQNLITQDLFFHLPGSGMHYFFIIIYFLFIKGVIHSFLLLKSRPGTESKKKQACAHTPLISILVLKQQNTEWAKKMLNHGVCLNVDDRVSWTC